MTLQLLRWRGKGKGPVVRVQRDALIIEMPGHEEKHVTIIPLEKLIKRGRN
jgi:hypothetical protein